MPRKSKKIKNEDPSISMIKDYNYRVEIINDNTPIYSSMSNSRESLLNSFNFLKNWKNEKLKIKIGVFDKDEEFLLNDFDFDNFNPESMEEQISLF